MARKRKQASPFAKRMEDWLELPIGSVASTARIELSDNRRAVIEGCQGIVEYDDTVIRVATGSGTVRFEGADLGVSSLNDTSAVIVGLIARVEWQN